MIFQLVYGGSSASSGTDPIFAATITSDTSSEIWSLPLIVGATYKAQDTGYTYQYNGARLVGLDGAADVTKS